MSDAPCKTLLRAFQDARTTFSDDILDEMDYSVYARTGGSWRSAVYCQERAWLGAMYYKAAVVEVVFHDFGGQTAGWLTRLSRLLLSRKVRKSIAIHSRIRRADIMDLNLSFYRLHGQNGAAERAAVRNIFKSNWGWALRETNLQWQNPSRRVSYSMPRRAAATGILRNQTITVYYYPSFISFSMQVIPSQFLNLTNIKSVPFNQSLFKTLQTSLVAFIAKSFTWSPPPYTGDTVVDLTLEEFEAKAYHGDGTFCRHSLDLINSRYHDAPRQFKIAAHGVMNSNETFRALMQKNGYLPNGGCGLTVHDGGSCFELIFSLSVLNNRKNMDPVRIWVYRTFKAIVDFLYRQYQSFCRSRSRR